MAAVSPIKRPEEQAPLTRFRPKLADNIKVYSMFAASRCAVLLISFQERADCVKKLYIYIYRVSQEEETKLRESFPYVKIYLYNPKHLYPKLNGYGDNGQRSLKL